MAPLAGQLGDLPLPLVMHRTGYFEFLDLRSHARQYSPRTTDADCRARTTGQSGAINENGNGRFGEATLTISTRIPAAIPRRGPFELPSSAISEELFGQGPIQLSIERLLKRMGVHLAKTVPSELS
jgi:hypothetical protein